MEPGSAPRHLAKYALPGLGQEVNLTVSRNDRDAEGAILRWKSLLTLYWREDEEDDRLLEIVQTSVRPPLAITIVHLVDMKGSELLLGAIVEGDGVPYLFSAYGDAQTLAPWEPSFLSLIRSIAPAAS